MSDIVDMKALREGRQLIDARDKRRQGGSGKALGKALNCPAVGLAVDNSGPPIAMCRRVRLASERRDTKAADVSQSGFDSRAWQSSVRRTGVRSESWKPRAAGGGEHRRQLNQSIQ